MLLGLIKLSTVPKRALQRTFFQTGIHSEKKTAVYLGEY